MAANPPAPELTWLSVPTPLPTGPIQLALTQSGVLATTYWEHLPVTPTRTATPEDDPRAALVADRVAAYFEGRRQTLDLPLDWRLTSGTQRAVLRTLLDTVPYGKTITYGELAERSGEFTSPNPEEPPARTVGTIMGANPLPLLIPCHRVVASDGIGGFGGSRRGIDVKRWLLTLEGVLDPTLDWNGPA